MLQANALERTMMMMQRMLMIVLVIMYVMAVGMGRHAIGHGHSMLFRNNNRQTRTSSSSKLVCEVDTIEFKQKTRESKRQVKFSQTFERPVVIAQALSFRGGDSFIVAPFEVSGDSVDLRMMEWMHLDGQHTKESINYLVLNEGVHTLDDGSVIQAGRTLAADKSRVMTVSFFHAFTETPLVLVTPVDPEKPVSTRIMDLDRTGFKVHLSYESTNLNDPIDPVIIHWVALKESPASAYFETGTVVANHKDTSVTTNILPRYAFTSLLTRKGGDNAISRIHRKVGKRMDVFVQEDNSNNEVKHIDETIGYVVFETLPSSWGVKGE